MPSAFYALVVCFIFLLIVFYYPWDVILIVFIFSVSLLYILYKDYFIQEWHHFKRYSNAKNLYKQKRKMSSIRRINLTEKTDSSMNESMSGYNYGRPKTNLSLYGALSPLRTNSKYSVVDENILSTTDFSNYASLLSPIRLRHSSPSRTSPLSYSRRYNTDSRNESSLSSQCSGILIPESSPSRLTPKKRPSVSGSTLGSPGLGGRMVSTANEMGVDEFPWVCPTAPIIPFIQSVHASSPQRDSPRSNRVRVRLTPHNSDSSMTASSMDTSVPAADESSATVKSVIQVLKEVSRKRSFIPTEEDEEQQKEAKRRPEHNMYLPRVKVDDENPPLPPARTNSEDDRKRIREPDWESPTLGSKRRRKNTYIVNNEILSSLSSSIGLTQSLLSSASEERKQKASVGTQVDLLKDSPDKKQTEQGAQTISNKPTKDVKEAATMPDPPPPSRPRSPVKEKVPNVNVILKSALSKFKIQPKEDSKKTDDLKAPLSFINPLSNTSSSLDTSSSTVPSSTAIISTVSSPLEQKSSLSLGSQSTSLGTGTKFSLPVSTAAPQINVSEKTNETPKDAISSLSTKKDDKPAFGFGLNTSAVDGSKSDSPFKFGTATSQSSPCTQTSTTSPTPSTFTFSTPTSQVSTSFGVPPKTQESVNTGVSTPSLQLTQAASALVPSSTAPANQSFQFGSTVDKPNEQPTEKNETNTSNLFSFGKVDNKSSENDKSVNANKPFQFGSGGGGFSFGQTTNSTNKDTATSPFLSSVATTSDSSSKPVFTFGDSTKKEEKSGGFSFRVPSVSSPSNNNKPVFSFTGATSSASATSSSNSNPSKSTAPIFPTSLFGSNTATTTNVGSASTSTTSTSSTPSQVSTALVASSTFGSAKPTFGTPSTSTTTTFGNTSASFSTGTTSLFGGNTATIAKPSIFGVSTATSQSVGSPSLFGNSNTQTNSTVTTTATSVSAFGSSSTPAFGSSAPGGTSISNPTSTTTSNSTFGSLSTPTVFSTGAKPTFGISTTTAPAFGSNTTTAPAFGNNATAAPAFGSTTTAAPTFGSTTTAAPAFGSTTTAPTFGSTTTAPAFGNTTTAPAFGSTTTAAPAFGSTTTAPAFGSITTAPFGNATSATPTFGGKVTSPTPTFGTTTTVTPTFGSSTTSTPTFGSNTLTFGQTAISTSSTTPAFGSSTFGTASSGTAAPAFGSGTTTLFGGNALGNSAASNTTPAFGASSTPTATPAFGSGTASAFGPASTPSFGSTISSAAVTPFGTQNPGFGSQSTPAFGSSSTPSFGTPNTFGSQSTTPSFGSTPAFGSSTTPAPAFGSSSSTTPAPAFGGSSSTTPAPAFGSSNTTTPALTFGSSSTTTFGSNTFGSQDASKPFTFNAPTGAQPAAPQTSGFNFTAAAPQSTGGLFQFGASSSNNQTNQPFQFSATQQSASTGFTAGFSPGVGGQQMFSIGSGSTAPRRTTAARRKK